MSDDINRILHWSPSAEYFFSDENDMPFVSNKNILTKLFIWKGTIAPLIFRFYYYYYYHHYYCYYRNERMKSVRERFCPYEKKERDVITFRFIE